MSGKNRHQAIDPPSPLEAPVLRLDAPSVTDMPAAAEVKGRKAKNNYEAVVKADVRKINYAITRAAKSPTNLANALTEILGISHGIEGAAASLDYPLLAEIARSLCRFIPAGEPTASMDLEVVGAHARALETVVTHRIRGSGGENGKRLLAALGAAAETALARE